LICRGVITTTVTPAASFLFRINIVAPRMP
jgi:hypothetical protein